MTDSTVEELPKITTITDPQIGLHQTRINCRKGHWDSCYVVVMSGPNILIERVEDGDTVGQRIIDDPLFIADFLAALKRLDAIISDHFVRLIEL